MGEQKHEGQERRREEVEEEEEEKKRVWKSRFLYGKIMDFSMECLEFVYGTLDGCLCFFIGKSTINPFLMNLGLK